MAIGYLHIEWLSSLALRSQIPAGAAVLDLGTSDIWAEREPLQRVAARHLDSAECKTTMKAIFNGKRPRPDSQRDFYSIFGAASYRSIDLGDPRADFALDLNLPVRSDTGVYDIVTNFGTTEHVFNISQTFANIHALLKVGGIQLHSLPAYGCIDHGFYNIHPCVYLDLARANAYEIVDLHYIDNINARMMRPIQAEPFDFRTLPIQLRDMSDTNTLMTKAAMLFHVNLQMAIAAPDQRLPICNVFDMMFVALRKTRPHEFVTPIQGVYAAKPPGTKKGILAQAARRLEVLRP